MLLDDAIITRRSIRKYKNQTVEKQDIVKIIEAARLSPSAKNKQPWYFLVMESEEKNRLADDLYSAAEKIGNMGAIETAEIIKNAPTVIAVYMQYGYNTSDILSIGGAIYGMCLKATDLGLGSLWIGDTDILADTIKYYNLIGAVAIGYPAEFPSPRSRKAIDLISNITDCTKKENSFDNFAHINVENELFAFISYSHSDKDSVISDIVELKRHGVPMWYDREMEDGKAWDEQAIKFIKHKSCKVFLLYITYDSLRSEPVFREFCTAIERMRMEKDFYILPILIGEDSTTPLLDRLSAEGYSEYAKAYAEYFTFENKVLFIKRSMNPAFKHHIEKILAFLGDKKIIADPSIYDNFRYTINGNECIITGYTGENANIVIPAEISGYPVRSIGESVFAENQTIRSVSLPSSIQRLSLGVFRGSGLERINIPPSVLEIQTACFRDCTALKKIKLPPHITYLAEAVFRGCTALEEIDVPEGVTELQEAVFRSCQSLKRAHMPSTLKTMTEGGFFGCCNLEDLSIPENVKGVEKQSFDTCPKLKRVKIGKFIFEGGTVVELG